jgi:quercetin dioxygenase-like cupin family protein
MNAEETLEEVQEKKPASKEALRKILLDNDQVRVIETDYPVKGTVPMHEHPFPHVLYVIEEGTAEITGPDGKTSMLEMVPGQALWRMPQSHSARNIGDAPFKIVEVEVKNAFNRVGGEKTPRVVIPADLNWQEDKTDPKRKSALLIGDPTQPGPYAIRFHVGAGYTIGLHRHPNEDENLTVLSGTLHWSAGAEDSLEPEHVLPAGGFVVFPAGTPHRLWTTEETELQMTGIGPRVYEYLENEEDRYADL